MSLAEMSGLTGAQQIQLRIAVQRCPDGITTDESSPEIALAVDSLVSRGLLRCYYFATPLGCRLVEAAKAEEAMLLRPSEAAILIRAGERMGYSGDPSRMNWHIPVGSLHQRGLVWLDNSGRGPAVYRTTSAGDRLLAEMG
jgi:hypothetical protein